MGINSVLHRHGVESMETSTLGGAHRRDLEFHIRKIHDIEQKGSCLGETSTTDGSQAHDGHSIHFESPGCVTVPGAKLDSSKSIKLNHSIVSSQSPHSASEHLNSALLPVQEEETMAREVDATQLMHHRNLTHESNLARECNLTYERHLSEEFQTERLKVEALRSEVHATRQDLNDEFERAASKEQEFTHEVGVLRMEGVRMQVNCAKCKNYQLKIEDLETALAEETREHELALDDCAELANLRLQLAREIEQRTLQERACDAANAEKQEYMLKFNELNTEHQKQQVSLVELKKINAGLELQSASSAEVNKQRQDMCDHQPALLRKLEAELEQARRDLVIEREYAVRLLLQIQQLQLEVKREKERASSQEIQLRDAFEEIKQQRDVRSSHFPLEHFEISHQSGSPSRKSESWLNQADLDVSQQKIKLQQVKLERDVLRTKQDDEQNLILQRKIDTQAQKKIRDEHLFLKQVEVMLEEAVEDIEGKKLQAVEEPTCVSHLHIDHEILGSQAKRLTSVYSGVVVVVDHMQKTTTVTSPNQSVQERGLGCRDRLFSWETTSTTSSETASTTPPAQDLDLIPAKS